MQLQLPIAGAMSADLKAAININGNASFVNNEATESGGKSLQQNRCFDIRFEFTLLAKLLDVRVCCHVVDSSHVRALIANNNDGNLGICRRDSKAVVPIIVFQKYYEVVHY